MGSSWWPGGFGLGATLGESAKLVDNSSGGGGGYGYGVEPSRESRGSSVDDGLPGALAAEGGGGGGGGGSGGGGGGGEHRNSLLLTACCFANGVVGAGIIGLPGALNQAGFATGLFLCVLVAVVSSYTLRLLAEVGSAHGLLTYPDLCARAFGPAGFYLAVVFQGLFALGAMCSYLVIFADTLPSVLRASAPQLEASLPALLDRNLLLALGSVLVLLPLSLLRHYGQLARVSVVKMFAMALLTAAVIYFRYDPELQVASVKSEAWKYEEPHADFFPALGSIAFAFVCHHQTFLALGSLRNPTQRRFALMVNLAIATSFALSALVAAFGYTTFWESTKGDIFVNYESFPHLRGNSVLNTARFFLALNMLVTYPSEMLVLRATVEALIDRRRRHLRWLALRAPVHDIVLLAQLRQQEAREALDGVASWRCGQWPNRAVLEHAAITLALFLATLGVAAAVPDLTAVLNVTGSFTAVMLAFVLPAAIRLRLGRDPYDETPLLSVNNIPSGVVLVFGVVAFVASTGLSLVSAVSRSSAAA